MRLSVAAIAAMLIAGLSFVRSNDGSAYAQEPQAKGGEAAPAPSEPPKLQVADEEPKSKLKFYQTRIRIDGRWPGLVIGLNSETGEPIPLEDMRVAIIRNGSVITETRSGVGGVFNMAGVSPGVYSLVAVGEPGLATFAIQVLPNDGEGEVAAADHEPAIKNVQAQVSQAMVTATVIPPQDIPALLQLLSQERPLGPAAIPPGPFGPGGAVGAGFGGGLGAIPAVAAAGIAAGIAASGDGGTTNVGFASDFIPIVIPQDD